MWYVLRGHERGCPCFGCCFLNMSLTREAAASVAMSHDPDVATISIYSDDAYTEKSSPMAREIMRYFEYSHLPSHLQAISKMFYDLAQLVDNELPECAESTVALRKLLEAKDAAVRSAL